MNLANNTILITGGGSGIGAAFAKRFLDEGSTVIICGRRADVLENEKKRDSRLEILKADVATPSGRETLVREAIDRFPNLNVLVNNAGIQRRVNLQEHEPWDATQAEIAINLEAPIHLCRLFIDHLKTKQNPAIINVTSGLAFVPAAWVPVYSATKAALHSFTLTLRHQLKQSPVKVIEIAPPAVNTDLGGAGKHTFGVPVDEFADGVFAKLKGESLEIAYGFSEKTSQATRAEMDQIFETLNKNPPPA